MRTHTHTEFLFDDDLRDIKYPNTATESVKWNTGLMQIFINFIH